MFHDMLAGLIWFQTVCKDYQQTTLAGEELKHALFISAAEDTFSILGRKKKLSIYVNLREIIKSYLLSEFWYKI